MFSVALASVLVPLAAPSSGPGDWPQWRGADGDGLSHGVAWAPEGTTRWTAEIGLGYSAASVSGGRVVAFGFDAQRSLDVLRAFELETGKELWKQEWPGELRANQHEGGTLSTPAIAGENVYTSTSSGTLLCHRLSDGTLVWKHDLAAEHELDPGYYGFAGSPLLVDGRVFVSCDRTLAFDAESGALAWKSEPGEALYSTPARFELAGEPAVAVFGQRGLDLFARADGAPRGSFPFHKDERLVNAATPVVVGKHLFLSSAYEHGCALVDFTSGPAHALWENKLMRNKMAGCVQLEGGLFGFDESVLKCLDLEGQERWRLRGLGSGAISGGDGKLAILSSGGELVVAKASVDAFQELSRSALFEEGVCWTPPTIAGGRILARNNRGTLVCRDHRGGGKASAPASAQATVAELPEASTLVAAHLAALGGAEALAKHPTLHVQGTYEQRSVGFVPAPYELWYAAPDKRRVDIQLPPPLDEMFAKDGVPGHISRVHDGSATFELNAYRGDKLYTPGEEREEGAAARLTALADWNALYAELTTDARVEFDERPCWRVTATLRSGGARTLYFDVATGLLAGREAENEALAIYRNYRSFDGLLLPTYQRVFRPDGGIEELFKIGTVDFTAPPQTTFARGEKVPALLAERTAGPR
ncbi:MAG: hypothetical protein EXS08_02835 [Planctomycetes bacterium]|nr:hypothetical protein [Planctomycetota bacterium]